MAVEEAAPATKAPFAQGSIIWEKKGPLPVWAWALLVLGAVIAFSAWRRRKSPNKPEPSMSDELPGDQSANPIFILPPWPAPAGATPPVTVPQAPPGGGRPRPPRHPPGGGTGPVTIVATKGTVADDWINSVTKNYGLYWNQIVDLNPDIPNNVSKSNDPRKRVFLNDARYVVRQ